MSTDSNFIVEDKLKILIEQDPQITHSLPDPSLAPIVQDPHLSLIDKIAAVFQCYADRPALGERAWRLIESPTGEGSIQELLPEFTTKTYREVWENIQALGSWLLEQGLASGEFVTSLGFTSLQYTILDLAVTYAGLALVPIQTSSTPAQITPILTEVEPKVFAVSAQYLAGAIDVIVQQSSISTVIVFDYEPEVMAQKELFSRAQKSFAATQRPINFLILDQILVERAEREFLPYRRAESENQIYRIIYTSGSTGSPKGAQYNSTVLDVLWSKTDFCPFLLVHYMPMSHIFGTTSLIRALVAGGLGYFTAKSDQSTLIEDISLLKPTVYYAVPRVLELFFHMFHSQYKTASQGVTDPQELARIAEQVKIDIRDKQLGGRLIHVMCSSAPLSPELRVFIEDLLQVPILNSYGTTETQIVMHAGELQANNVIDYKLIDVPELGYYTSDQPHPRGELLLKVRGIFQGYYRRPEITATVFEGDFYKTGDIMEEIRPGIFQYIDRRNNVVKLAQGEFITVAKLEADYSTSDMIEQIFIYVRSDQSYLLAVIVPIPELIKRYRAGEVDMVRAIIMNSLQEIGKEKELQSYEIPRDFVIETNPFTRDNGLLSGISKLLRPALKCEYGERLDDLYAQINAQQEAELAALRDAKGTAAVSEIVARAMAATLGIPVTGIDLSTHFGDLGGDSLSALSFSGLLQDIFQLEVPVNVIISPTASLHTITEYIENTLGGNSRPIVDSVHGRGVQEIMASDLKLDKFISADILVQAATLTYQARTIRNVLLTGANGYLGRFLCLEWLERLAQVDGKLYCIARGADAEAARQRIIKAIGSEDLQLAQHFHDLAEKYLVVIPGDLSEPRLGVSPLAWEELSSQVDHIVHCGALVNHVLPYNQMFASNVLGTAEIISLALNTKLKSINYLSTVAVVDTPGMSTDIPENSDIRESCPERYINQDYANGYANSKWAGEVLLREAHAQFGIPVTVFRSDMILANRKYAGQLNITDAFTRWLLSIIITGLAPKSFYKESYPGERAQAHYDGIPADFTAAAITILGAVQQAGYRSYNVFNSHEDGISLDTFVDWMIQSGISITRIDDYTEWLQRFTDSLKALPEKLKQASILPLLHAYAEPEEIITGSPVSALEFRQAVKENIIGGEIDIPHLDEALIKKYISDLKLHGLVEEKIS